MFVFSSVVACVFVHLAVLRWMWTRLAAPSTRRIPLLLGGMVLLAILAHLVEISIFSGGMLGMQYWIEEPGDPLGLSEMWYASATAYTSLDAHKFTAPSMRLFMAVEALTGLILIAWTASFLFLAMQRLWDWK